MKEVKKTCFAVLGTLYCVLLLCRAQYFNCTVTQHQDVVIYKISDESRPADYKASGCSYVCVNSTGHTIATNQQKTSFLMESSINKLMASGCIENIVCRQHCKSKRTGFMKDFMANCTASCTEDYSKRRDMANYTEDFSKKTDMDTWCTVLIVIGVIILIVLIGLLWIFRNKLPRYIHSPCSSRRYHFVRRKDTDQPQIVPV